MTYQTETLWAEPYFEEIPEGIYKVLCQSVEMDFTQQGKAYLLIKFLCVDGEYTDCPLPINIWHESGFGQKQLKGIIRRLMAVINPDKPLTPQSHLEAGLGIGDIITYLNTYLVGAICEIRVEENIKDGKTYTNNWFHAVEDVAKTKVPAKKAVPEPKDPAFNEAEIPF